MGIAEIKHSFYILPLYTHIVCYFKFIGQQKYQIKQRLPFLMFINQSIDHMELESKVMKEDKLFYLCKF